MPPFISAPRNLTHTLTADQLPSIHVGAEREDVPLTASASDLTIQVSNAAGEWRSFLDVSKIVGALPPSKDESIRVPVVHYGRLLLCRRMVHLSQWQVLGLFYVDPISPVFDGDSRSGTVTAYAPGKLLELGDAERVNRFKTMCPGRPFLVKGNLSHPVVPPGAGASGPDDRWWLARNIAPLGVYPGDEFKVVHEVAWSPGVQVVEYDNTVFTITQVSPSGNDVYFQTKESSPLILGPSPNSAAIMEYQNPWYRSRRWESLVTDLIAEVNEALIAAGVTDQVSVDVGGTAGLPLLPIGRTIFSQPINMSDVLPSISGVAYIKVNGTRRLLYTKGIGGAPSQFGQLYGKSDILGPNDLPGEPVPVGKFNPSGVGAEFGPDFGVAMRIFSPTPVLGSASSDAEAGTGFDFAFCGQDLHSFNATSAVPINPLLGPTQTFDSTHWARTPSSYTTAGEPKRFYRIYGRGRFIRPLPTDAGFFRKGITVRELTTSDNGTTWTLASIKSYVHDYPDDSDVAPNQGRWSARPEFKVFKTGTTFLYCWTDPFMGGGCYFKANATDDLAASALPAAPTSFVTPDSIGSPVGSSGFVTEGLLSNTVWFFCDRVDGQAVDLYYWNGSAFLQGAFADTSGKGFPNLQGGDFINAITDTSGSRRTLYVMQGRVLYVIAYSWNPTTGLLTSTDWQAVEIDQTNYDPVAEAQTAANGEQWAAAPAALAWLTGPVIQANVGEPDYVAASSSCIVATPNYIYIISNAAVNIVDVADFGGLSVAAALSELILVRGYQMLTEADQYLVPDPNVYDPVPFVRFRQRLLSSPAVVDLSRVTERCDSGSWLENYQSVQVQNTKIQLPPVGSDALLTTLDGVHFSINPPRNAKSAALTIECAFISTRSFAKLLANTYAPEFAIPRPSATAVVQDPYSVGLGQPLRPCDFVKYLTKPPDSYGPALTQVGRVLTIDYQLETALDTLRIA